MIWWKMLELATGGDAGALANLLDTYPALVVPHVAAAADAPEGWLAAQRERHQAMAALKAERYLELADLVAATARHEGNGGRLATLWALEIVALRMASAEPADGSDDDLDSPWDEVLADDDGFAEDLDERAAAQLNVRLLERLAAIAGQLGRSVPAQQRPAVARVLCAHMFAVSDKTGVGLSVARAAAALLEHLPDDPTLLLAAEAGFVCGGSRREAEAVARRIAARGVTAVVDPEAVGVIMRALNDQDPRTIASILAAVRPLFPAKDWAGAVLPIAEEIAIAAGRFIGDYRGKPVVMRALLVGLELLAPHLEGVQRFEAARAVAELTRGLDRARARFEAYGRRFTSLAAALDLLEVAFFACAHGPGDERRMVQDLAAAAIERLGPSWETWISSVPILVAATDGTPAALTLHRRLRAVLQVPGLPAHVRITLEAAVDVTGDALRQERRRERQGPFGREPGGKRARRSKPSSGGTQLKLDL